MVATVACVLRSGGVYDERWVRALERGVREFHPGARFVCLSDVEVPCERIPLEHQWPGWWSKLELFRPGTFDGPVLYMDLDTLVVGPLTELLGYDGGLAMLSDFYRPEWAQTGVVLFTPGEHTRHIWDAFTADPEESMRRWRGDGEFVRDHAAYGWRIQSLWPGRVVSYKVHATGCAPPGASLVCGHGTPRFSSEDAGWAHELWAERAA